MRYSRIGGGGSPVLTAGASFQGVFHRLFQSIATETFGNDPPLLVQEISRGNTGHAVFAGEFVLPSFAVEILRPGHLLVLDESGQLLLILVQADSDDVEAFVVMLLVS